MKITNIVAFSAAAFFFTSTPVHADLRSTLLECIFNGDPYSPEDCAAAKAALEKTPKTDDDYDIQEIFVELQCTPPKPTLSKRRVSGSSDSVVRITCDGEKAKALYEAVRSYAREGRPTETDTHARRMTRIFGDSPVPSQCYRVFETSNGQSVDVYFCSIGLDLNSSVVKAM